MKEQGEDIMKTYRFEIQKCININIEADDEIEARMILIDNPSLFQDKMIEDCYISDGVEINGSTS